MHTSEPAKTHSNTPRLYNQWFVKFSDLFCNKSLGGSARRYLVLFRHHFDTLLTSVFISTTTDGVTSFFSRQQCKLCMYVIVSVLVNTVGGICLFDGRKLEESEGYNYCFIAFYVLESK